MSSRQLDITMSLIKAHWKMALQKHSGMAPKWRSNKWSMKGHCLRDH